MSDESPYVGFRIPDDLREELREYILSQVARPTKSAVLAAALRIFLEEEKRKRAVKTASRA
jgi:hypothetical protein